LIENEIGEKRPSGRSGRKHRRADGLPFLVQHFSHREFRVIVHEGIGEDKELFGGEREPEFSDLEMNAGGDALADPDLGVAGVVRIEPEFVTHGL
jgi:hypothetical protein